MRQGITRILVAALFCLLLMGSCQERQTAVQDVLMTLDSLEHKLEWLDYRLALEIWDHYTTGMADSLDYYNRLYNSAFSDDQSIDLLQKGKSFLDKDVNQRRRELLFGLMLSCRVESEEKVTTLRDSLLDINLSHQAELEGEPCSSSYLHAIYCTDKSRIRREMAYRAWREVGNQIADGLARLLRLRNQEAHNLGYNSYLAIAFDEQNIDQQDYHDMINQLDSLSNEPYRQILENVKLRLSISEPEIWDLSYAYSNINREIDNYFPVDSQMPFVLNSLEALGFDLDKLPIYFNLTSQNNKPYFVHALPVKPPHDVRVTGNLKDGFPSTQALMYETGHALHAVSIRQDSVLFALTVNGCWVEGMGRIFSLMCDDPVWLERYAHVPAELINRYQHTRREQDIIDLRKTLTRLAFEYEAYANPDRNLNKLYWDLFERYMLLPRHDAIKPWAAFMQYTTHPVYLHSYLFGDIIAAQTLGYLEKNYDSIVDNPQTRSFLLQNYMRFGSRYKWRDLLKRGTDEEINIDHFAERLGI